VDPQPEVEEDELMDKLLMALLGCSETDDEATKLARAQKLGAALQSLGGAEPKALSALLKTDTDRLAVLCQMDGGKLKVLCDLDGAKLKELSALSAKDLESNINLLSSMDEGQGAAVTAVGKRVGEVETTLKALSQDNTAFRRAKILSDAAAKGKAIPDAWLTKYGHDVQLLSDMIDGLPENVVPLSQQADPGSGKRSMTVPTGAEADVAKVFGRKPEDLKGV
jgi:phage I-like protein